MNKSTIGLGVGVIAGLAGIGYVLSQRSPPTAVIASPSPASARPAADGSAGTPPGPSTPGADAAVAQDQQAVLIHLRLSDGKLGTPAEVARLQQLELTLEHAIDQAKSGELDGNEIGDGEYVIDTYGPDADKLYASIERLLRAAKPVPGSFVIKRYGSADDEDAQETRVELAP